MIRIQGLHKYFNKNRQNEIHVINDVSLELPERGMVAIFGKSGCGKTTLLNVIGGLDGFESGALTIGGEDIRGNTDVIRNQYIGYIFQNYNLQKTESCFENVADALRLCGMDDASEIKTRVRAALCNVGMEKYAFRTPDTLSGGQQQRIAIARAIVKNPRIILADEPTGNLDEANTVMIMDLLKEIAKDHLVLLVTHEANLVDFYCDSVIELSDGRVVGTRQNEGADGFSAKDKNHIFLGELEERKITGDGAEISYYGEKPSTPLHLTIVNHNGKLYLRTDTPGVQILDETSEIKLREGVYKESREKNSMSEGIDMSLLPPVQGTRFGRLFSLKSAIKSGYFSTFKSGKRRGRALRRCMGLFSAVIVFMSAIFGTAFGDILKARDAYNHNVFYVYTPSAEVSKKLNSAGKASGIDLVRLMRYFPSGDEEVVFQTGSFETFQDYDYNGLLRTNAVYLDTSLTKDMKLLAGKKDGLTEEEILISSKVADALLEKSVYGYITEYKDLCGLVTSSVSLSGKNVRVAGVVEADEPALYLTEIAMARYVKDRFLSASFFALASDYGLTVKDGEATLVLEYRDPEEESPSVLDTIPIRGMDFKITSIIERVPYEEYLTSHGIAKLDYHSFFTALLREEQPTLSEGTEEFSAALEEIENRRFFEYFEYYYSESDAFVKELYLFCLDRFELWLYMEKGIELGKCFYLPSNYADYLSARDYKQTHGSYPARDEVDMNASESIHEQLLEYQILYEEEFYSRSFDKVIYNTTYLVSDKDYIALCKRIGETHPSATYKGGELMYQGEASPADLSDEVMPELDYDSVYYTVVHSSDPEKTQKWLEEEFADLDAPVEYYKAIYTPDLIFETLIRDQSVQIISNLITLVTLFVLMSLCMYFIMRSSLMNRIREVGIYRAIGVSKKNLVFKFFIEALVLTTLTVFIGYLLTSTFMFACLGASSMVADILYYPLWLAGVILVLLYGISLFFGVLPILSLLKKTPSEILAKYDI